LFTFFNGIYFNNTRHVHHWADGIVLVVCLPPVEMMITNSS